MIETVEMIAKTLLVIGSIMILLGLGIMFIQGAKDDICNRTTDIEWYYKNCVKGE